MKPQKLFFRGSVLAEWVSRTLFVGIVILFVYGGFAYYVSKKTFDDEMGNRLLVIARLTAGQTQADWLPFLEGKGDTLYRKLQAFLDQKKHESMARNIFILDESGRVLVDANGQYEFKETNWLKDLDPEPFKQAVQGVPAVSILFPERDGGIYKIGYSPLYMKNGRVGAVLGVEASANFIDGLTQFAKILFIFGLACLFLMGGLLYAFGRRFIAPIEEMASVSIRIAEGDFSQRVGFTATNELGALAHAFNDMAKRLQTHNEYILESMSNGLVVADWRGTVTSFNRAASMILEIPQGEIIGRHYEEAFEPYPVFRDAIKSRLLKRGQEVDTEINLSEESPKFLRLRSAPLLGAEGQELGMEILFSDETQVRKLQAQIKASEKMATIGELAAGIAHEIRNPLGAMKGFTEILSKKLQKQPETKEMVADIAAEIEILNKIVTNFLVFARPTTLETQDADASEVILALLPLVQQEASQKKVRVRWEGEEPIWLSLDVEQFRRAVLNLALNAVQASPKGGLVTLGIRRFNRSDLVQFLHQQGAIGLIPQETEPQWCCFWVEDEGGGIAPENLSKLFTPFFTTKTEGFGLGLSITQKIAEALGGQVAGINRPDGGARFLMILPAQKIKSEAVTI